jgi:hypothetical protein
MRQGLVVATAVVAAMTVGGASAQETRPGGGPPTPGAPGRGPGARGTPRDT